MKRKNNILTYKQATNIVENSNGVFTESKHLVDGFNISIFNYRLATYENFINPINDPSLNYLELRGLTFVFNKDGSLFKRYLLMEKFFNINENKGTQLVDLNKLKIKSVYNKEDGSVISFVKLPNNKVVAKSKASFDSYQANKANFIYNNDNDIKSFVDDMLDNDIVPIFEYVSPFNKIVINYTNDELILFRIDVFRPLKLKFKPSILGFPNVNAFILPFFAYLSISGPPGYLNPKTLADLSKASPAASSNVVPIISMSLKSLTTTIWV